MLLISVRRCFCSKISYIFYTPYVLFWPPVGNLCLSPGFIFSYCSMVSAMPNWHWTDTCIHHLSTHMVNSKLHIYHLVRYLVSWYIINKLKHDSMKNSSFTLLIRTGLGATFDLVMLSTPLYRLIQNSLRSLPSVCLSYFFLAWAHISVKYGKLKLPLNPCPLTSAIIQPAEVWLKPINKWRGKGDSSVKWCLSGGLRGKWQFPLLHLWVILLINDGRRGRTPWLAKNTGLFQ